MTKRFYIGYDSGTMGTKVAIYTIEGELVADAYREHEILYPKPGWAEMEAEQFYRVAADAVGAGLGEVVLYATGSAARQTVFTHERPCDGVIMAIVDQIEVGGELTYDKAKVG